MINILSDNGNISYGVKDFCLDSKADLKNLPKDCRAGSTAFVIEDNSAYMLNSSGEWVKI